MRRLRTFSERFRIEGHAVTHLKIDYVELASRDIGATQGFLAKAFGWTFVDYGPAYQAFVE